MLLLSSATRILATESPPGSTRYRHHAAQIVLEHSGLYASIAAQPLCVGSRHAGVRKRQPVPSGKLRRHSLIRQTWNNAGSYQGSSFFNPFFLLLDSFWLLSLFACVELLSVFELSLAVPFDGWLVEEPAEASAPPAGAAAGFELDSGVAAAGAEEAGSLDEFELTSSDEPPAAGEPSGGASPGFTVATMPVFPVPEPIVERFPPERMSAFADESVSGSMLGKPCAAAVCTSGPPWKTSRGL